MRTVIAGNNYYGTMGVLKAMNEVKDPVNTVNGDLIVEYKTGDMESAKDAYVNKLWYKNMNTALAEEVAAAFEAGWAAASKVK